MTGRFFTVVVVLAELLARFESVSFAPAVAVFVIVVATLGTATIVSVILNPGSSMPALQMTVLPFTLTLPWLLTAETKPTLAGNTFVTITPVACDGPRLLTVT